VAFNIRAASLPPNEKPSSREEKIFDFTLELHLLYREENFLRIS